MDNPSLFVVQYAILTEFLDTVLLDTVLLEATDYADAAAIVRSYWPG